MIVLAVSHETARKGVMHGMIGVSEEKGPQSAINGRWYAVLIAGGMERRACIWLRLRQMEPYWPRYEVGHRDFKSRRKMLWRSVLPGYIFLPAPADCGLVEEAPGVHRFMRYGSGDVAELDNCEIDRIKEIEMALNDSAIAAREGIPFKAGQQVYVPKLELTGKIQKLDGRRRIVVSVPMFGSFVPVTVSVADIESV